MNVPRVAAVASIQATESVASVIAGCGMSLPEKEVPNSHFAEYLDTSDQWIRERTGIRTRRWVEPGTPLSDLAVPACQQAITEAGLSAKDIDAVIVGTVTGDHVFPSTACVLQGKLGTRGFAFDLNAVCSGFLYALVCADGLIAQSMCRNVLVVGADIYSNIVDMNDRATCVLFGDGAGAIVLRNAAHLYQNDSTVVQHDGRRVSAPAGYLRGLLAAEMTSDGNYGDVLKVPMGSACLPTPESLASGAQYLHMEGREVFKLAVRSMCDLSLRALSKAGLTLGDVDYMVSHQANRRILFSVGKQLAIPEEKILVNLDRIGNTSAASIPILLAESVQSGKIKPGNVVLLSAFGAGVTCAAAVVRW